MSDAIALVRTAAGTLAVESASDPGPPGGGEVLVDVDVVLLGPEDRVGPSARAVGREAVGVVRQVGASVPGWHPGDRVALASHLPCGRCPACEAGRGTVCPDAAVPGQDQDGWARSSVVVPAHGLFHVPGTLEPAQAALVPGAVATAYHALKRAGVGPDVTVAVLGEDAVATHAVQLAALAGSTVVAIDRSEAGREHALDLGADEVVDPAEGDDLVAALSDVTGDLVDRVVLTPTGAAPAAAALGLLRPGGRLVVVRPPGSAAVVDPDVVPVDPLVTADLDVVGTRVATPGDVRELFDLADDGRLVLATSLGQRVRPADASDALTTTGPSTAGSARIVVELR